MKNHIFLLISIIGIPFLVLGWSALFGSQTLPIVDKNICVYQVFGDVNQRVGVASYLGSGIWISAWHVIDPDAIEDIGIGVSSGDIIGLGKNIQNIGNDIGLFELQNTTDPNISFNEKICDTTSLNGLLTYISGALQKIPVEISGTFIEYNPSYGQSGSPLFRNGKIIGVISRKYDDGAIISLIH